MIKRDLKLKIDKEIEKKLREPKIVKDLIEAQEKIEKEWYKCPECGAEGHNTHYSFCSQAKKISIAGDFGAKDKTHVFLYANMEIDKSKIVKNIQSSHIEVDDNFLKRIGAVKAVDEESCFFVSVKKYNKLKNDFADFKIKYFRLILLIFLLGTIFGFVFGVLLPSGGG